MEQVAHAVSDVPEHPRRLYLPDPHVAHVAHALLAVDEQAPVWNLPVPQAAVEQAPHGASPPALYFPAWHGTQPRKNLGVVQRITRAKSVSGVD